MSDGWLSQISKSLEDAATGRETNRMRVHEALEARGPVLWLPDPENPKHGIGWFRGDTGFIAYQKWSNGWAMLPVAQLDDELLKAFIPHMPKQ